MTQFVKAIATMLQDRIPRLVIWFTVSSLCFAGFALAKIPNNDEFEFRDNERIAIVGSSNAERMNLFGYFEATLHSKFPEKNLVFRNFAWPADEVGIQQRPDNYTLIDNPLLEFGPELFICFFGFNEHFAGDSQKDLQAFRDKYLDWIKRFDKTYSKPDRPARFVLVSPSAVEMTINPHLPDAKAQNKILAKYAAQIESLAAELKIPYVDLLDATDTTFNHQPGMQFTINGVHVNEAGDKLIAQVIGNKLFDEHVGVDNKSGQFEKIRAAVNDKSWFHLQDYRMLNGWYVYGGRRTWDKETFPGEYQKIRKMVEVRDQFIWDIASGKDVPDQPDDSKTGEVFIPETMFGTRDDNFRRNREPKTLKYPTPEESIEQMTVLDGLEVQLFASEREFPELANPTQMAFDNKGRLWVSCMINYPQWLPGSAKPGDKLLIFEDTDNDGKADVCKTFYDRLICPTGFEFHEDGVLVVDEPRILFLRDTDGDDKADEATQILDGIATDDTHHAMGAWEWSHGGLLYMLEGVSMSTTLETPWGPFRNKGPSGGYMYDPISWKVRHFRTPGYGNPWCLVFDKWGMGMVGDGTNAQQHWTSPLSGYPVSTRKTLRPNFNNEGMRPAVGNDFLISRHLPEELQGHFTYACVINMHGLPRFDYGDEPDTAGYAGKRVEDLINSTDNFFRPVDPQIGPDGALWFGDWCNALIGHMQYSQRDPNRDHQHGRIYRLVNKSKPLITPELQAEVSIPKLIEQLTSYELRTRYRARRELRARNKQQVLKHCEEWLENNSTGEKLCEVLWLQESFRSLDRNLVDQLIASDDFHVRAAAVHSVANEISRFDRSREIFDAAILDPHPRVRLEAIRGLSYIRSVDALTTTLKVLDQPMDYWLEYTLEHALHGFKPLVDTEQKARDYLATLPAAAKTYYEDFVLASGPGGKAVRPLRNAMNPELPKWKRDQAISNLARISGGNSKSGMVVYERTCSACHTIKDAGKEFGPALDGVAARFTRREIIKHILDPNAEISKGFETVQVLTLEGQVLNGFVLEETDTTLSLGVATDDGKGKRADILKDDIDERKDMKASSMPEGLVQTIAPAEFIDLIQYLSEQIFDENNWISTIQSKAPLRTHAGFTEVSRDAKIQIAKDFPAHWNNQVHYTLAPDGAPDVGFAFHSPQPATQNPSVIIKLSEAADIRHIKLQNRRDKQFHNRAKGLAVWTSTDGSVWKKIWKADKPAAEYTIDLESDEKNQFVKVGLDGKGIFHLNQIVIFGER